jgi:hypothetical protein
VTFGELYGKLKEGQRQPINIYPIGSRASGNSDDLVWHWHPLSLVCLKDQWSC